jgi:hypothetical protein
MFKINIDKLLNKIIIVLCAIIIIAGFKFLIKYKEASWSYQPDPDYLIQYIQDKEYRDLSFRFLSNNYKNPKGKLNDCMVVANYYKNTSFHKMYEQVGNDEKAMKYLTLMDENISDMGDLSFVADDINKEFENYTRK